jgi:putative ABC transport system permease protein
MDFRYALRALGRNPGYAAIVILILAVGIGANTAMFSIVDGVLLRALPFREPEQLYAVQESVPKFASLAPDFPVNALHFRKWKKHWTSAEQIGLLDHLTFNLTSGGEPERVNAERISWNLFPLLGVYPQLGRGFLEEEDKSGRDQVVLLSDAIWHKRFHADPGVLGQKIVLNDRPYQVIGVMPAGLKLPRLSQLQSMSTADTDPDIWKPLGLADNELEAMGDFNFGCMVRMKKGVAAVRALDELNAIEADIVRDLPASEYPEKVELQAHLAPLQQQLTGRSRKGLLLLFSAVGAVLLIVCVNIANLLLARATGRRREFAIRGAVGASTRRLLRQMLTESLVVAVLGGGLGIAIAYGALGVILKSAPDVARMNEVRIDGRVLALACGLTLFSAMLFGFLPAWRSSRLDPQEGLRSGGRSATESRHSRRLRTLLVALEVGLSTICLAAAGLLLNSFVRLTHIDKGFDAEHAMSIDLYLAGARYSNGAKRSEFLRKALEVLRPLPGVTAMGVVNVLPLTGEGGNNLLIVEGRSGPLWERPLVDMRSVNGDYFRAMGIPLRSGRVFQESDGYRGVAIVGESTAWKIWPGENPLGKKIHFGEDNAPILEVIGVAGDVRGNGLQKAPQQVVYLPYWYRGRSAVSLVIRTGMNPTAIAGAVRVSLRKLDPELPVPQFRTMQDIVSASVAERRFQLSLVLVFAGIALGLACLGIFGVVSYTVAQRRGEMGIRLALGATAGNLRGMVVRQGLMPVLVGLACGISAALALGRVIEGLLFGVRAGDPCTLAGVSLVLIGVAAAACYIPALRVSRADPLTALRYE